MPDGVRFVSGFFFFFLSVFSFLPLFILFCECGLVYSRVCVRQKTVTARPWRREEGRERSAREKRRATATAVVVLFVVDVVQYLAVFSLDVTARSGRGVDALLDAYVH